MTHGELVKRAAIWLRGSQRCKPVFTEQNCWATSESPDAFGINNKGSIVVECKASAEDFRADRRKSFRQKPEDGMGRLRYYFAPEGVITDAMLDTMPGWGLVEVVGRSVRVRRESAVFRQASNAECLLLRSAWLWKRDMDLASADGKQEVQPSVVEAKS